MIFNVIFVLKFKDLGNNLFSMFVFCKNRPVFYSNILWYMRVVLVIVLINLMSLWLSPVCVERLALVALNVFFHFLFMQQLSWYIPSNGDVVPLVGEYETDPRRWIWYLNKTKNNDSICFEVRFYETSLWLTVILLIVAIVSRGMNQSRATVPIWLAATVAYVDSFRLGQLCLRQGYLVDRVSKTVWSIHVNGTTQIQTTSTYTFSSFIY